MSRKLGPRTYGKKEELVFLGRDISETRNYSDATAHAIDEEVSEIITRAHRTAKEIITKHRTKMEEIAQLLIREETIDRETFDAMFDDTSTTAAAPESVKIFFDQSSVPQVSASRMASIIGVPPLRARANG